MSAVAAMPLRMWITEGGAREGILGRVKKRGTHTEWQGRAREGRERWRGHLGPQPWRRCNSRAAAHAAPSPAQPVTCIGSAPTHLAR
jgi:hypothetical protein